jgi:hypothetical protein
MLRQAPARLAKGSSALASRGDFLQLASGGSGFNLGRLT